MESNSKSIQAVFLDRDGVINDNSEHYYVFRSEQWKWNPDLIEALQLLQQHFIRLFIVSNQGGISKGLYERKDVAMLHEEKLAELASYGIKIEGIAICPHHPDIEACFCRKPSGLMLERLLTRFHLNAANCFLIGDSPRDIEAAAAVGMPSVQIEGNTSILELCKQLIS